jgi:hypothetical protein
MRLQPAQVGHSLQHQTTCPHAVLFVVLFAVLFVGRQGTRAIITIICICIKHSLTLVLHVIQVVGRSFTHAVRIFVVVGRSFTHAIRLCCVIGRSFGIQQNPHTHLIFFILARHQSRMRCGKARYFNMSTGECVCTFEKKKEVKHSCAVTCAMKNKKAHYNMNTNRCECVPHSNSAYRGRG